VTTKELNDQFDRRFNLALQRLSATQLRILAKEQEKSLAQCVTKLDMVNRLVDTMSRAVKLEAMKTKLLAGRSISFFRVTKDGFTYSPAPDFQATSSVPSIVGVGPKDEIVEGSVHVMWAILQKNNAYTDRHLQLREDAETLIVDSFWDPDLRLLHVRGSVGVASRIRARFAEMNELKTNEEIARIGAKSKEDFTALKKQMGGKLHRCSGNVKETKGMAKRSGTRHEMFEDLEDTEDYKNFLETTEPLDFDMNVSIGGKTIGVSVGLDPPSFAFRCMVNEATVQHLTHHVKLFCEL
jgi:hypothetical protein